MPHYRIYRTSIQGHVLGPPDVIDCPDDQEAIEKAARTANGKAAEVWDGARFIVRFPKRRRNKALGSIEQNGAAAALERCRQLSEQICTELRAKKPGNLEIRALAEFQVTIERACVLNEQLRAEPNH